MPRTFLLTTVFSAIFFICFLGMRNPYIHDNHRPKSHPRAIIEEESSKSQQDFIKSLSSQDFEAAHAEIILPKLPCFPLFSRQLQVSPPHYARQFVARAPPTVSSRQI